MCICCWALSLLPWQLQSHLGPAGKWSSGKRHRGTMIKNRAAQRDIIRSEWRLDKRWGVSAKRDETDYLALMERDKGSYFPAWRLWWASTPGCSRRWKGQWLFKLRTVSPLWVGMADTDSQVAHSYYLIVLKTHTRAKGHTSKIESNN